MQTFELPFNDGNPVDFNQEWEKLGAPTLELPEHAYGPTEYIDGLLPEDMTHPAMKGVDCHGRPFVAVRIEYQSPLRRRGRYERTTVEVYFQRYTDEGPRIWASGGNLMPSSMKKTDKAILNALLEDGQFTLATENRNGGTVHLTYKLV